MVYVLIGILALFIVFSIWAIKEANDFKAKKKEKKAEEDKPKMPNEPTFEVPKEKKEKKIKIKKEKPEKKKDDGSMVVPVFEAEEETQKSNNFDDVNDDLYKNYMKETPSSNTNKTNDNVFDFDKRMEEMRRSSGSAPARQSNEDKSYYSFSAGIGGKSGGSLRDPNFNPWPDEKNTLYEGSPLPSSSRGFSSLLDDDDDDDMDILDRIMRGRGPDRPPMPERSSRLGAGSVKSSLGRNRGQDIIVGQTIANRRGGTKPDGNGDKK